MIIKYFFDVLSCSYNDVHKKNLWQRLSIIITNFSFDYVVQDIFMLLGFRTRNVLEKGRPNWISENCLWTTNVKSIDDLLNEEKCPKN